MLTGIPSPYREETHARLSQKLGTNYHVFYCAPIESNRLWKINHQSYSRTFLKRTAVRLKKESIYFNFDIIKALNAFNPDVVITAGFPPTMLLAFIWTKFRGRKHIPFTDATIKSEEGLTFIHKWVRKLVYSFSDSFIGASTKSMDLYLSYKVKAHKIFLSPLCINNCVYKEGASSKKRYEIMFSGQFIDRKMPLFFVEVVRLVNESHPCKVILIGSGELKDEIISRLNELQIEFDYPGFIQQDQLPSTYSSARVLLFPTKNDPWGVVANEACAVGVPVITCENAGVAHELIIHGQNGFILPLDPRVWAEHIITLLTNITLYDRFSHNAVTSVQVYNYENAVDGIWQAIEYAHNQN